MFQAEVKLEFVRRYCSPQNGWKVIVDIDASEEGRTGGKRKISESIRRQKLMMESAVRIRTGFDILNVTIAKEREKWFATNNLPSLPGDRDVIAFHPDERICLVAEIEGDSSGQPEQKLYKAIGQIVLATSVGVPKEWTPVFAIVVHAGGMSDHLARVKTLAKIGISALSLDQNQSKDTWLFGAELLPKLLKEDMKTWSD